MIKNIVARVVMDRPDLNLKTPEIFFKYATREDSKEPLHNGHII